MAEKFTTAALNFTITTVVNYLCGSVLLAGIFPTDEKTLPAEIVTEGSWPRGSAIVYKSMLVALNRLAPDAG